MHPNSTKPMKLPAKTRQKKGTKSADVSLDEALARQLQQLSAMANAIEAALAGGTATPALARESATVARALVHLSGERRARNKEFQRQVAQVTDDQRFANVLAYVEHLMPASKRKQLRELLDRLASERGVLS